LQGFEANLTRFALLDLVEEYRKCIKEVAVTPALEVKASTATRKLELDEMVEVLGQMEQEEATGLLRSRCRTMQDGLEGWVTINGNQGTAFLKRVAKPYYFCKAPTLLLESCASSSTQLGSARRAEVLEVLEGPRLEKTSEVMKAKGKTKDNQLGWVLFKDEVGKCFFQAKDLLLCKGSVALTDNFDIGNCKAIRKLEVGERLQPLEEPRDDEKRRLVRMKVKALSDGKEGWATSKGNQGTMYVAENARYYTCVHGVDLEIAPGKVRKLEAGEDFELLAEPSVETRQGKRFARGRCLSTSAQKGEGWFAIDEAVQPWTHRQKCLKVLSLKASSNEEAEVVRELALGEEVEICQAPEPTADDSSSRPMVRVRAKSDGAAGFVPVFDEDGKALLF